MTLPPPSSFVLSEYFPGAPKPRQNPTTACSPQATVNPASSRQHYSARRHSVLRSRCESWMGRNSEYNEAHLGPRKGSINKQASMHYRRIQTTTGYFPIIHNQGEGALLPRQHRFSSPVIVSHSMDDGPKWLRRLIRLDRGLQLVAGVLGAHHQSCIARSGPTLSYVWAAVAGLISS